MRSLLFVPADDARKLARAIESSADVLILDLEDSVAPDNKAKARAMARAVLDAAPRDAHGPRLFVRINALDTALAEADLDAVMPGAPAAVVLPKSRNGADVQQLGARLAVREAEYALMDGATGILAIATETAGSLFGLHSYGGASHRLIGLAWGAEDLSAALGAETARLPDATYAAPYQLARTLTLVGARAAGVKPVDTVFTQFRDAAGLRLECEAARRDGFTCKLAIHPGQIEVINEVFSPGAAAIAEARAVVAAFAAAPGAGVVALDGRMLDRPHLLRARQVLARAGEPH